MSGKTVFPDSVAPGRRATGATCVALLATMVVSAAAAASATVAEIRQAAMAKAGPALPHPLPLAAHWNTGEIAGGFDPRYQAGLLQQGRHVLPWFQLYRPDQDAPLADLEPLMQQWARLGLPISFVGTQWDVLVAESIAGTPAWNRRSDPSSTPRPQPLSPTSPLEQWYAAGRRWGSSPQLRRLEQVYPEPPVVVFVSNNEQPKVDWTTVRDARLPLPGLKPGATDDDVRRAVADAWVVRYRELLRGFRDGLPSEHWRQHSRFIGYEAYGQPALGRWGGWAEYSLHSRGRIEPWSAAWDGASVPYYTGNWDASSDFRVWSPQVEAMNFVPMLEETRRLHPDFWFEMSTWDGRSDELDEDKDDFYRSLGQEWTVQRYAGMVQFGMWLLRPRVVREFRDTLSFRRTYDADFQAVLDAVDRVYRNPVLKKFWQTGQLVPNRRAPHPYQNSIPAEWQGRARWFLLDADANPARPWALETSLEVFALALEIGERPRREWLVYAHSPRSPSTETVVTVVDGIALEVLATRRGCFSKVAEVDTSTVERIAC